MAPDLLRFLEREGPAYETWVAEEGGQQWFVIEEKARRPIGPELCDPAYRMQEMDRLGVTVQALSCPPFAMYPDVEAGAALAVAQVFNDTIAQTVSAYPDRFVGLASVPLQQPSMAAEELERAIRRLGLRGVQIGTRVGDRALDDPSLAPFWEAAAALVVPVVMHPFDAAPPGPLGRCYLGNLVGNPIDTALAAALLIFGGVLERNPGPRVVLYHAGGAFPAVLGRLDHGYKVRPECSSAVPRRPGSYMGQLFFDSIAHDRTALLQLIQRFGSDKVLLGSDYPVDVGVEDPVGSVRELELAPEATERVLAGNARSLLRLGEG